ncbi:MAG TPA: amidohydrolase family protein [Polyangiaceae bacterium]|nr:amidohydrolase family protein [Polyangiaceae bacterium]
MQVPDFERAPVCIRCAPQAAALGKMPALNDPEGASVPSEEETGGAVVDAHVHLFPPRVYDAIWRWFESHAWPVRYRLYAEQVVEFMASRGVRQIIGLHYAHAPGMADALNAFAAELGRSHRDLVVPLGTVLPGEPGAAEVVRRALGPLGLHGLKLHCHVQRFRVDDPRLDEIYEACSDAGKPIIVHAGREPSFAGYPVDPRELCEVGRVERVLRRFPRLTLVVPHLGLDEVGDYLGLLATYENLYLDTTMACAGYFPPEVEPPLASLAPYAGRLLYGTDFPTLPFAWDRELRRLVTLPLDAAGRRALFSGNARRVYQCG